MLNIFSLLPAAESDALVRVSTTGYKPCLAQALNSTRSCHRKSRSSRARRKSRPPKAHRKPSVEGASQKSSVGRIAKVARGGRIAKNRPSKAHRKSSVEGTSGNRLAKGVSQLRLRSIGGHVHRRRAANYSVQRRHLTRLMTPANERIDRSDVPLQSHTMTDDIGLSSYQFQQLTHDNWDAFEFPMQQLVRLGLWKYVAKTDQWPRKADKDAYDKWEAGCEKAQAEIALCVTAEVMHIVRASGPLHPYYGPHEDASRAARAFGAFRIMLDNYQNPPTSESPESLILIVGRLMTVSS